MTSLRVATEDDLPALAALDTSFTAGQHVLVLTRSGAPPELTFAFEWREGSPHEETYGEYSEEKLRGALTKTDLFLVAEEEGAIAGLLMVVVPRWTDAGEITDLAVDRVARRRGAGRALVDAAMRWARERSLRALWVEPRADNADAIEFYLKLGFRVSGFNDRMYSNADDAPGRATIYLYRELS